MGLPQEKWLNECNFSILVEKAYEYVKSQNAKNSNQMSNSQMKAEARELERVVRNFSTSEREVQATFKDLAEAFIYPNSDWSYNSDVTSQNTVGRSMIYFVYHQGCDEISEDMPFERYDFSPDSLDSDFKPTFKSSTIKWFEERFKKLDQDELEDVKSAYKDSGRAGKFLIEQLLPGIKELSNRNEGEQMSKLSSLLKLCERVN